jgi:hypothetical protein
MCGGQPFLVFYISFEEEKGDHFQSNMVRGNMEKLGKLVGEPCCT